jgi:hypothetical protein
MKVNTAINFVLSGIALWLSNLTDTNPKNRRIAVVIGGVVAVAGSR